MKKIFKKLFYTFVSIMAVVVVFGTVSQKADAAIVSNEFILEIRKYSESSYNSNLFYNFNDIPFRDKNIYENFGFDPETDSSPIVEVGTVIDLDSEINNLYAFLREKYSDDPQKLKELENIKKNDELERLEGACFRIYILNNQKDVDEFANHPEKYSTVEEVNEYIRKCIEKDPKRIYDFGAIGEENDYSEYPDPNFIPVSTSRDVVNRVYDNKEDLFKAFERSEIYTNEDGIARLSCYIHSMEPYFWIVENTEHNIGEAGAVLEGTSVGMLYKVGEVVEPSSNMWGSKSKAVLYPKNSTYTVGTDKNVDLKKTVNNKKNEIGDDYSEIYKLGNGSEKEFISKNATLDSLDYINWVIDTHIDPRVYKDIDKFEVTDYLDNKTNLLSKSGKPYLDLINATNLEDADISVSMCRRKENGELEEKTLSNKNGDYTIEVEFADGSKKEDDTGEEDFGTIRHWELFECKYRIIIKFNNISSVFKDVDKGSTINLKINIGTQCKYNEVMKESVEYGKIYNDHNVNYTKNDSEKLYTVKKKPRIPWVSTDRLEIKKYKDNGHQDVYKNEIGLEDAKFVIYREVKFYDEDENPVGESSVEFLTENGNFMKVNDRTVYKYDKEKDKIYIDSGEKTLIPKLLTSDEDGLIEIKSIQGGTADMERKKDLPLDIDIQEGYKIYEEREFPVHKKYTAKYYIKEVCPPPGYRTVYNDNVVVDELENAFKDGKFTFKVNEKDNPVHVYNNERLTIEPGIPTLPNDDVWMRSMKSAGSLKRTEGPSTRALDPGGVWIPPVVEDPSGPKPDMVVSKKKIKNELSILPDVGGKGILLLMLTGLIMIIVSTYCLVKKKGKELTE